MDGRSIGCASDDPVERIDLPNKVPLPQSTNCGIAAHGADFGKVERNEARPRTHSRSSAGRFDPGMAAADYKNVKIVHCERALTFETLRVKAVFHVKHALALLADTELSEQGIEHLFRGIAADQTVERGSCQSQVLSRNQ